MGARAGRDGRQAERGARRGREGGPEERYGKIMKDLKVFESIESIESNFGGSFDMAICISCSLGTFNLLIQSYMLLDPARYKSIKS